MSDERCGPWVYASKRRRSRECRSWNMTDEQLAARRQTVEREMSVPQPSLIDWAMQAGNADAGRQLSIHDFHELMREMRWTRERDLLHGPSWREMHRVHSELVHEAFRNAALHGESTKHPVPPQERTRLGPDINDRARRLVESALGDT